MGRLMGLRVVFVPFACLVACVSDDAWPPGTIVERLAPGFQASYLPVEGGPHNISWTFPEVVNPALLEFLGN
jgi:pimeloyl-ACP methyl ester carboxylesterase